MIGFGHCQSGSGRKVEKGGKDHFDRARPKKSLLVRWILSCLSRYEERRGSQEGEYGKSGGRLGVDMADMALHLR